MSDDAVQQRDNLATEPETDQAGVHGTYQATDQAGVQVEQTTMQATMQADHATMQATGQVTGKMRGKMRWWRGWAGFVVWMAVIFGVRLSKQAGPAGGGIATAGYIFGRFGDRPYGAIVSFHYWSRSRLEAVFRGAMP